MKHSSALSSAHKPRQRGLFSRIFLRPFAIGLVVSFMAGVGVIGWMHRNAPVQQPSRYTLAVPAMQPVQRLAAAEQPKPQIFDFRGSGHAVSDSPRPMAMAMGEPEMDGANLADIAPAAGPAQTLAAAVAPVVVPQLPRMVKPQVAIVIDDIGPDYQNSMAAIRDLPKGITFSVLPYAERLQTLVERAKAGGHELLLHMPMEPVDMAHNNPGPQALTLDLTPEQIRLRVQAALSSFDGYVGLNNHMGSRFTADMPAMRIVMGELAQRDLIFFDSRTTPQSVGIELATRLSMKFAGRDVFLDNEIDPDVIAVQLSTLERLAKVQGHATAIGHPHPATLAALKEWLPKAQADGIELVPISALAQRLGTARVATGAR